MLLTVCIKIVQNMCVYRKREYVQKESERKFEPTMNQTG